MTKNKILIPFSFVLLLLGIIYVMNNRNTSLPVTSSKQNPTQLESVSAKLSPLAYSVMYEKGTERPYTSTLNAEHRKGTYVTADTGLPVFRSEDKYDSGTGWPSFTNPIKGNIEFHDDTSLLSVRTEVVSRDTSAHLGHVFDDGPLPLGKRYCINGVALVFIPDEVQ